MPGFDPWVGKIPWRRAWQPTPVFLPGESPWTVEPGGLQSMGSQRVRHDWMTKHTASCVSQVLWFSGSNSDLTLQSDVVQRKPRLNSALLGIDSCFAGAVSHPFLPSMLLNGIVTAAPRMLARKLVSNYQKQFCFWYGPILKIPSTFARGIPSEIC